MNNSDTQTWEDERAPPPEVAADPRDGIMYGSIFENSIFSPQAFDP